MPETAKEAARTIVKRAMRLPLARKLRLVARLAKDRRVRWITRIPLVALLLYLAMPLDIIPDFIPIIGHLDDLLVALVAVWWFVRTCPPEVAIEHLDELEATPLSRMERAVPWIVGVTVVLALVAFSLLAFRRDRVARSAPK